MFINKAVPYNPITICEWRNDSAQRKKTLTQQQLNHFLSQVERRAYRMAMIATRQQDEALDIVQDAMIKLAQSYGHKPQDQWQPLFYRILHNRIMDWHRKKKIENSLLKWLPGRRDEEEESVADLADTASNPEDINTGQHAIETLERELHLLPARQRQAFLLRSWEGLSVAETAKVMGCSEGSVKTHFFRAVNVLKEKLGEHWP